MRRSAMGHLNEAQQRSLWSALTLLDEAMNAIRSLAASDGVKSTMYTVRNPLSKTDRAEMICLAKSVQAQIGQMAKEFGLQREHRDVPREIRAKLASLWEMLYESDSRRMRGYGEVSEDAKKALDPAIARVIKLVEEMNRLV